MLQQRHNRPLLVTAEDLLQSPICADKNSTIYQVVEKILNHNISGIVFKTDAQFGILSQKDIASILLKDDKNIKEISADQKAQEITCVDQYAPISNCAHLMLAKKTNALGIKYGREVKGIITKHDLVRHYQSHVVDETKLSEIMSVGSFFVQADSSIYDALHTMLENQISRLLVRDENERPLGIITYKSFLSNALYNSNRYEDNVFSSGFGRKIKVGEITKKQIITVSINTSLIKVAKILIDYRIHGVAVTKNQKIVGFVTEKDIVRQLTKIPD